MCQGMPLIGRPLPCERQRDGRQVMFKCFGSIVDDSLSQQSRTCSDGTAARHDDLIDTVILCYFGVW